MPAMAVSDSCRQRVTALISRQGQAAEQQVYMSLSPQGQYLSIVSEPVLRECTFASCNTRAGQNATGKLSTVPCSILVHAHGSQQQCLYRSLTIQKSAIMRSTTCTTCLASVSLIVLNICSMLTGAQSAVQDLDKNSTRYHTDRFAGIKRNKGHASQGCKTQERGQGSDLLLESELVQQGRHLKPWQQHCAVHAG